MKHRNNQSYLIQMVKMIYQGKKVKLERLEPPVYLDLGAHLGHLEIEAGTDHLEATPDHLAL